MLAVLRPHPLVVELADLVLGSGAAAPAGAGTATAADAAAPAEEAKEEEKEEEKEESDEDVCIPTLPTFSMDDTDLGLDGFRSL
jgi:60s Acidic ribosomal protein